MDIINYFDSLVKSIDTRVLPFIVVGLVFFFVMCFYVAKHIISNIRETKLKKNPETFGYDHIGKVFKIREVCEKMGVALLAMNPTKEHPLGDDEVIWFDWGPIPIELRREAVEIKVEFNKNDITCEFHKIS